MPLAAADIHAHLGSPPAYIDPDLISIRSAAPSYTSSVPPTYTASLPAGPVSPPLPPQRQYSSLIPPSPIPSHHQFNVASWPSLSNHSQSRAYLNVAARRARRAADQQERIQHEDILRRAAALQIPERDDEDDEPQPQREAAVAGPSRNRNSEDALRAEQRSWDFFHAQITDWEHREVSWRAFKEKHENQRKRSKGKGRMRWSLYGRFG
ncbi:hypothetical protein EDC01DRAFT_385990 [Geopyxis carbonaria]|nr:hypothetical protein EDC01DRAFT_385990 [Geopyxis carbonaria]